MAHRLQFGDLVERLGQVGADLGGLGSLTGDRLVGGDQIGAGLVEVANLDLRGSQIGFEPGDVGGVGHGRALRRLQFRLAPDGIGGRGGLARKLRLEARDQLLIRRQLLVLLQR